MGLDMYLYAKKHISNFDFYPQDRALNREIKEILGLDDYIENGEASLQVQMTVAYWRKFNAIHKWFVDNCQGGVDDCQVSWVTREKLVELRDLCVRASDDKDSTLLPTTSGFFFGSTEVDEFYWDDIDNTALKLSAIIADEKLKDYDFYYHASW